MLDVDVVIIGAGASGLMCAIEAGKRGRKTLVLDHANKAGKKILMSGGGRCNFTNYTVEASHYLSNNAHFCKSALSRYTQWDFIDLVTRYQIPYHERDHGQLFCNDSAKDILNMLLNESTRYDVEIKLSTAITEITESAGKFSLKTTQGNVICDALVIATGGLSIPKMGATPFGYKIAEQFDIPVVKTRAGLVPFTLQPADKDRFSELSGIAVNCTISNSRQQFTENLLFTHRGLSGPVVLQISSYWLSGETIQIDLLPSLDIKSLLNTLRQQAEKRLLKTILDEYLPKRLLSCLLPDAILNISVANLSDAHISNVADHLHQWQVKPNGTEGYRTAEVTIGGVDCEALSSKTMASKTQSNLYFIGEVVDVSGWLGGYNFQWAWASGWCAGQYV